MINKVSLIGLGAMGAFLAPKLHKVLGDHFSVIAKGDRAKRLSDGVVINGEKYKFNIVSPNDKHEVDLVIIAVKFGALQEAILDIKNQVGEQTLILSVLNGLDSEVIVSEVYGEKRVLPSLMRVSVDNNNNEFSYSSDLGSIYFGEMNREISDRVLRIEELMTRVKIPFVIPEDMRFAMWHKFMANIGENMVCALLNEPFGVFRDNEYANYLRISAMNEVVRLANHQGIMIGDREIQIQNKIVVNVGENNRPSTVQDLQNQKPTEVDMFSGKVCELGKLYDIPTPVNKTIYNAIKVFEGRYLNKKIIE